MLYKNNLLIDKNNFIWYNKYNKITEVNIMIDRVVVRTYTLVLFGAALSQDKSAHFYCYDCASGGCG